MEKYRVMQKDGRWTICFHEDEFESFDSRLLAIQKAIEWAHNGGKQGHEVQVLAESRGGQWETVWTHGKDHYPPAFLTA